MLDACPRHAPPCLPSLQQQASAAGGGEAASAEAGTGPEQQEQQQEQDAGAGEEEEEEDPLQELAPVAAQINALFPNWEAVMQQSPQGACWEAVTVRALRCPALPCATAGAFVRACGACGYMYVCPPHRAPGNLCSPGQVGGRWRPAVWRRLAWRGHPPVADVPCLALPNAVRCGSQAGRHCPPPFICCALHAVHTRALAQTTAPIRMTTRTKPKPKQTTTTTTMVKGRPAAPRRASGARARRRWTASWCRCCG